MSKRSLKPNAFFRKCKVLIEIVIKNDGVRIKKRDFDPVPARSGAQATCQINPEHLRIPLMCGMLAFLGVPSDFFT